MMGGVEVRDGKNEGLGGGGRGAAAAEEESLAEES